MDRQQQQFVSLIGQNLYLIKGLIKKHCPDHTYHEDMLQDVLLQAWRTFPSFRWQSAFATWLHTLTRNTCINHYYKIKRQPKFLAYDEQLVAHIPDTTYHELSLPEIKLNDQEKQTLVYRLEGKTFPQISSITGESEGCLRVRFARLRERYKQAKSRAL